MFLSGNSSNKKVQCATPQASSHGLMLLLHSHVRKHRHVDMHPLTAIQLLHIPADNDSKPYMHISARFFLRCTCKDT